MDLVPPLGIENRKINPNGTVPKKEHGTMNTKKTRSLPDLPGTALRGSATGKENQL